MRTLLMVLAGVVLALAFHLVAAALNRRGASRIDGARLFIWIWLAVASVDFWVGVDAGNSALLELGVHLLIFALPAALAWYLSRRHPAAPAVPK